MWAGHLAAWTQVGPVLRDSAPFPVLWVVVGGDARGLAHQIMSGCFSVSSNREGLRYLPLTLLDTCDTHEVQPLPTVTHAEGFLAPVGMQAVPRAPIPARFLLPLEPGPFVHGGAHTLCVTTRWSLYCKTHVT